MQPAREIDKSGLVRDRQQRLGNRGYVQLSELPAVQWRKRMKGLWKPFKSRRERGQSAARGGEDPECTR